MPDSLTDLTLRKLKPRSGRRLEVWDARVSGFGVRVSPAGHKSFVLVYRFKGRTRRMTLGRYPVIGLAEAREAALEAIRSVKHGLDPQAKKVSERTPVRFDELVKLFLKTHCARTKKNTRQSYEIILRRRFTSVWGARDIKEITRSDVIVVLDKIMAAQMPSSANHALVALRIFFNWCIERGYVESSPCARIKLPAKVVSRDRVLSATEIGAVWRASVKEGYPFGMIVQLLLLTGQRRTEVSTMRWCDLDLEAGVWKIPKEVTKNSRAQSVPLVPEVVAILKRVPHTDVEFVFPAHGSEGKTFSGFSKSKDRVHALVVTEFSKGQDEEAEVEHWTLHDLRRTGSTKLAELGVAPHIIERLLNHVSGVVSGVAGVYNRFRYADEVRAALVLWTQHVKKIVGDETLWPAMEEAAPGDQCPAAHAEVE